MANVKYDDYEVKEAARTLIRAKEIMNDPKLGKLAKAELRRQAKAAQDAVNEADAKKEVGRALDNYNKQKG